MLLDIKEGCRMSVSNYCTKMALLFSFSFSELKQSWILSRQSVNRIQDRRRGGKGRGSLDQEEMGALGGVGEVMRGGGEE